MIREAVAWWLAVEVVGLVALPITLLLFRNLLGRGYAFAKPVGLLLGAYLFWLGMEAHLLPNRPGSIVWAFQFVFTSISAVYQFLVIGLRLFLPLGLVCLVASSYHLAKRMR